MGARVPVSQRRKDLVEAAFRTMAAVGITGATTRAICAEAGVHQSVFHYCFHSKSELYQELVRVVVVEMVDDGLEGDEIPADVGAAVQHALRGVFDSARAHPDRQQVAYELTTFVLRDEELAPLAAWQYEQYFGQAERVIDAIAEATNSDVTISKAVLSRMFATVVDGLVLGWLTDRNDAEATAALDAFSQSLAAFFAPAR